MRNFDDVVGDLARELVALGHDGDDDAVARFDFLDIGTALFVARHGLGIGLVARGEHHDRKILVDQGVRAVLHFAGGVAFGVNVGNFLELQRAFERDRVVDAARQIEKIGVAEELPRQVFEDARWIGVAGSFPSCAGCE